MTRLALLLVVAVGVFTAWVALRDWKPAHWSQRVSAESAAAELNATLLDRRGPNTWRIRIGGPSRGRCMELDLQRFERDAERGIRGLRKASCPP